MELAEAWQKIQSLRGEIQDQARVNDELRHQVGGPLSNSRSSKTTHLYFSRHI